MSSLVSQIYTGMLNGKPLRFFRAPLSVPHLPWHSYDDLMRCIGVKQSVRNENLANMRAARPDSVRTIACGSDILLISPHYAARFSIAHLPGIMRARKRQDLWYRAAMIDAWYASMNNRLMCDADDLFWIAMRNTDLAEAGWAA